jgi:acetamidase/formamidase
MTEHALHAQPTHSVWDRSLEPRLHIAPGDEVAFECVDASGGQVQPGMTLAQYLAIDRTRIHALTGPVWVEGAEPGDVLEIDVLSTRHAGWGWSSVIEGLGFLKDRFREPYLFHWQLEGELTMAPSVRGRRGHSEETWMCANSAPDPSFTCRSSIGAHSLVAATDMRRRAMARYASTASSARWT